MRVLQVNCVYRSGSTGKIVYDLHTAYKACGIESYVCYGRGTRVQEENVYKTAGEAVSKGYNLLSRFTGIQYGGAWGGTRQLIKKFNEIRPDIVHLHCINGFFVNIYKLLEHLKKERIKTVLTLHAEFMYTGSCGYALECEQWKEPKGCKRCPQLREATNSYFLDRTGTAWRRMKKAFEGFDDLIVTSVSPWLEQRAKESVILGGKAHTCVLNGIDTDVFRYKPNPALWEQLGLTGKKVVLYVTAAFSEFKGANYILELARRMPDVMFLVAGNQTDIGDHPENIIPLGRVQDQNTLAQLYSTADVTVLTSKKETFSMVCAESLSCGTPVVGFEAGAPETISIPQYSDFCPYGDTAQLEHLLNKALENPVYQDKKEIALCAGARYAKKRMCTEYIGIYERLLHGH